MSRRALSGKPDEGMLRSGPLTPMTPQEPLPKNVEEL